MKMKDVEHDIRVMLMQINDMLSEVGDVEEWTYSRYNNAYIVECGYKTVLNGVSKREIHKALTATVKGLEQMRALYEGCSAMDDV